jgi:hypothetical protein
VQDIDKLGFGLLSGIVLCAVVTGLVVVSCARISTDDGQHQGRIAGSRFFVAVSGALALLLLGEALRLSGLCTAGYAAAVAAPEVRLSLFAYGLQMASSGAWIGWLLALIPLTAGTCGSLHWVRRVDGRVGIGGAIAIGCVVTILVMLFIARSSTVHHIAGMS